MFYLRMKFTKNYNARALSLFCSLILMFNDVHVAAAYMHGFPNATSVTQTRSRQNKMKVDEKNR